jgi:hypothetical protein
MTRVKDGKYEGEGQRDDGKVLEMTGVRKLSSSASRSKPSNLRFQAMASINCPVVAAPRRVNALLFLVVPERRLHPVVPCILHGSDRFIGSAKTARRGAQHVQSYEHSIEDALGLLCVS